MTRRRRFTAPRVHHALSSHRRPDFRDPRTASLLRHLESQVGYRLDREYHRRPNGHVDAWCRGHRSRDRFLLRVSEPLFLRSEAGTNVMSAFQLGTGGAHPSLCRYAAKAYVLTGEDDYLRVWEEGYAALQRYVRSQDGFWVREITSRVRHQDAAHR